MKKTKKQKIFELLCEIPLNITSKINKETGEYIGIEIEITEDNAMPIIKQILKIK